ncbi:hypothetical protein ACTTAK_06290 [Rhodobacter capsulatus]|uniref:hypothetical protein n=2 Tax=Rhodobacter capsulatus TaxID=1061 RepID=UPI00114503C4|nr:hypothetical protein [Rhodobacter capsulatus]TQD37503.1 hypothetical protein FKW81_02690 [Rhodobacter capsulatus]
MFLYLEGVNLYATIYDTEDLSTIRGGSMALETLAQRAQAALGGTLRGQGASTALLEFSGPPPEEDKIRAFLSATPQCHFTLTWGTGETEAQAIKAARDRQFSQLATVVLPAIMAGVRPCAIDHTRPGTISDFDLKEQKERFLCASVADRRKIGRVGRPQLFRKRQPQPPQSFEDIAPEDAPGLKPNVRGKIAVIVADGMGGGDLAKAYGTDTAGFSTAMAAFRARLAEAIEDWASAEGLIYTDKAGVAHARVDVLMWGGDDMTFVVPASHVLGFLAALQGVLGAPFDKDKGTARFGHRIGCVIAQRKTPIRLLKKLAGSAEAALRDAVTPEMRKAGVSVVSLDVFESAPLPFASILDHRRTVYGQGYRSGADAVLLSHVAKMAAALRELDDEEGAILKMSQIYRLLDVARLSRRDLCSKAADEAIAEAMKGHFERVKGTPPDMAAWENGWTGQASRGLALLLAQVAQLQPYAQPFTDERARVLSEAVQ